ncbi:MAG TPA: S41 family peptidase, partial [Planctomycetota bacterium]|nr:S41 family peptidase [Planctomycetota bacterium]
MLAAPRSRAALMLLILATCFAPLALLSAADHAAEAQAIVDTLAKADPASRWNNYPPLVVALQTYPDEAPPVLVKSLKDAPVGSKLVISAALVLAEMPDKDQVKPLGKVGGDQLVALLEGAANSLSQADRDEVTGILVRSRLQLAAWADGIARLKKLLEGKNKFSALAAARILNTWKITFDKEALVPPLLSDKDATLRNAATFAACELDLYHTNPNRVQVLQNLKEMAGFPNAMGDYAANMQRTIALEHRLMGQMEPRRKPGENGFVREDGEQLLRDITDLVTIYYADEEKIDLKKLYEQAAIGMVNALDPFSSYMTEQDVVDSSEKLEGKYYGIGAYVGMRDNLFTIISPIYGSPADKAGLKSMDRIIKVDDTDIRNMTLTAIIKRLKGPVDTAVKIEFWRRGLTKPRIITVKRAEIVVPSVIYGVLPGDIAYIRLTNFGQETAPDCKKAMIEMRKDHEIRGVVLDLRNNPGGLLTTAVGVSSLFLDKGKLVVFSQGRPLVNPKHEYFVEADPMITEPVAVLVNTGSASASEIVSGALHDHHRAFLVGEKTFGKGSVQQPFEMPATNKKTELRLTIAKYYLPNGECIHEKGIEPDIAIETPLIPGWKYDDFDKIVEDKSVEKYFDEHYKDNEAVFDKLAAYDGGDGSLYPDFKNFYASLKTHLGEDDVRLLLRAEARKRFQESHHQEFSFDVEEDTQLRRALLELDRKNANLGLRKIEVYKNLDKEFEEKVKNPDLAALLKP